jgi:hypothetical protein
VDRYVVPSLDSTIAHQVQGGELDGAIYQLSVQGRFVPKFFPYYVARCIPALLSGFDVTGDDRYKRAACQALDFVARCRDREGAFPQVLYPGRQVNRFPRWIAGVGDILRAIVLGSRHGSDISLEPTLSWLLGGQLTSGGFRTAHGFASQVSQHDPRDPPEFRDLLPVCGWSDKAFRFLTEILPDGCRVSGNFDGSRVGHRCVDEAGQTVLDCQFDGRLCRYVETDEVIELRDSRRGRPLYQWRKGEPWARVNSVNVWLK